MITIMHISLLMNRFLLFFRGVLVGPANKECASRALETRPFGKAKSILDPQTLPGRFPNFLYHDASSMTTVS